MKRDSCFYTSHVTHKVLHIPVYSFFYLLLFLCTTITIDTYRIPGLHALSLVHVRVYTVSPVRYPNIPSLFHPHFCELHAWPKRPQLTLKEAASTDATCAKSKRWLAPNQGSDSRQANSVARARRRLAPKADTSDATWGMIRPSYIYVCV